MNDKIEKMLNELGWGMGDPSDDCMQCSPFDPYKFAELIVKECSKILRNGAYWSGPNGFVRDCTAAEMASTIEEHFGVE
ncbi:hypothetical protein UFOVP908_210 [uncultured Caudovirales phage]|uniref:Uncharacterized protein n=1 Tax=uncultured Caudovirales phage TaxID=2100421 RepID=A0A6J5QIM3_9CAUD|nr:hypothetical protein UFOVP908_210 [uncultured Caudovirales phage]CAB4177061.1 hypothetical protein UFOVP990_159 [uncultured Caudovirales phage]CAB4182257.1 hypothetical protein UFOVP1065_190 [uncultured Caudovirales phage]CAB4190819.1 hypothetical protein UFOVP1198_159 [uncultured Caudovirales phage]CAB4211168.1 hypothetical protein UFOVP1418_151 [uncultured Caudovirales phage]